MSAPRMTEEEWSAAEWDALNGKGRGAVERALLEARRARESEAALLEASEAALRSLMDPNTGQADTLRLLRAAIAKATAGALR